LKSKDKWVTCYIELPNDGDVSDIDVATVELWHGSAFIILAEEHPIEVGDYDGDGVLDLMVKFGK